MTAVESPEVEQQNSITKVGCAACCLHEEAEVPKLNCAKSPAAHASTSFCVVPEETKKKIRLFFQVWLCLLLQLRATQSCARAAAPTSQDS